MSSDAGTLTLNSTTLYTTALNSGSGKSSSRSLSLSLPPIPSSIPQPKLIPKTRFIIDGFRNAGDFSVSYFLSHFHSDHYAGLSSNWSKGIIFCSFITANLLIKVLNVPAQYVVALPLSELVLIDGSEVYLIDANHCPGAVQFLFKVPASNGKFERYVHTGDFRYRDVMKLEPVLNAFVGADAVFLDTTYCHPKFIFPSQEESIDYIVGVIEKCRVENEGSLKNILFLIATYVIGKEKILVEVSRRCRRKIHVDGRKMEVLEVLGHGEDGVFTTVDSETDVHVIGWNVLGETWPYFKPHFEKMDKIMNEKGFSKVVGFVPTGWTYEVKRNKFSVRKRDSLEIHLVPYSEHSNYDELRQYVKFLKPKHVIPTVGTDVEKLDSKHANAMRKHFAGLVDEMANKQEFLMGFHRSVQGEEDVDVKKSGLALVSLTVQENTNVSAHAHSLVCSIKQENEDTSLDPKSFGAADTDTVIGSSFCQGEPVSQGLEKISEGDIEELLKEIQGCLPTWVTKGQMLDLLSISGKNVVDAVTNFYEHETEYREQVTASNAVTSSFEANSANESALPPKPCLVKSLPQGETTTSSKTVKLPIMDSSSSKKFSPGKRKRSTGNKILKKAKGLASMESGGPKQCTITTFFSKTVPLSLHNGNSEADSKNSHNDNSMSINASAEPYKEETDQFIQIVNGDESLRSYATTVLVKTKGDISMALDIYFSEYKDIGETNEEEISKTNKLVHPQCAKEVFPSSRDAKLPKILGEDDADLPLCGVPIADNAVNYVSLPPEKYSPVEHACWSKGQAAPYIHLARTFELVKEEKGKIKATSMLCNMFRSLLALSPEDVLPAVYLCTNKIAPDHENMELNIGGSTVVAALEEACGTKKSRVRELYNSLGDLGDVAQLCRQTQSLLAPPVALTVRGVYSALRRISLQAGSGSAIRKKSLIVKLMCSCREKEMKFLVRTLVRNLRIGAMMRTVLPALAQAVVFNSIPHEGLVDNLKDCLQRLSAEAVEAYNILPSLDVLVPSLMEKGVEFSSNTLSMAPGIPIKPMLAKITNGVPQVLRLFQNKAFTCEYKYDGQRAQIHKLADGSVRVFSRNGDETTSRFPDLVNIITESCGPRGVTFILDAEVVAIDRQNGSKLMSFQELSSRERGSKGSIIALDKIKVDICIFVFDIMFANGEQLLNLPLRQRRKYLKDLFGDGKVGYFEYATEMTVEDNDSCADDEATLARMNSFLNDALNSSCEGIMVKSLDLDAGYTPSKRSDAWLKVKRDYVEGLNDSLDLVPIGAWYGNGRKAGWYSPFLMACYNPDTEEYQSVCRVMSGFSDSFYVEMRDFFDADKISQKKPPYYRTAEAPDMWFSPEVVWEIRGADFTVSPVHHAAIGLVHPSRGISVRFPRFIRCLSDRKPEECSTSADIAEMFHSQTRKMDVNFEK
ncbi:putative histone chaperone ASF1B-like [Capsicum annuum]|uniref:DNA ligase 6 isoform X1 n=1 Tax=Capsicum annuum TaxID=4072 RepID=UPI001FB0DE25|nr:DNA ligase 6 isoform X1 [Capsicum annuum]KAF3646928.1 putative histone chaperone ASF1B-like [Capsicum annuum]